MTRHTANDNGGHGIFTPLEGVVDGGKNRAHGNGNNPSASESSANSRPKRPPNGPIGRDPRGVTSIVPGSPRACSIEHHPTASAGGPTFRGPTATPRTTSPVRGTSRPWLAPMSSGSRSIWTKGIGAPQPPPFGTHQTPEYKGVSGSACREIAGFRPGFWPQGQLAHRFPSGLRGRLSLLPHPQPTADLRDETAHRVLRPSPRHAARGPAPNAPCNRDPRGVTSNARGSSACRRAGDPPAALTSLDGKTYGSSRPAAGRRILSEQERYYVQVTYSNDFYGREGWLTQLVFLEREQAERMAAEYGARNAVRRRKRRHRRDRDAHARNHRIRTTRPGRRRGSAHC